MSIKVNAKFNRVTVSGKIAMALESRGFKSDLLRNIYITIEPNSRPILKLEYCMNSEDFVAIGKFCEKDMPDNVTMEIREK